MDNFTSGNRIIRRVVLEKTKSICHLGIPFILQSCLSFLETVIFVLMRNIFVTQMAELALQNTLSLIPNKMIRLLHNSIMKQFISENYCLQLK